VFFTDQAIGFVQPRPVITRDFLQFLAKKRIFGQFLLYFYILTVIRQIMIIRTNLAILGHGYNHGTARGYWTA
jgi:hypothetical protein